MDKKCSNCNEYKPLTEYYANPRTIDGFSNKCKECYREYARVYAITERGKIAANQRKYLWGIRHPLEKAAHAFLRVALKAGRVKRLACAVCGNEKSQAHHENYEKPMEVVWLCARHHAERHSEMRRVGLTP
jgi:hypothetical protein